MGLRLKSTGVGLKHFFGARNSISDLKTLGGKFKQTDRSITKAKIVATMGMYTIYKGSPIGLAKNIYDSIKLGKWDYSRRNQHAEDGIELLQNSGLSQQGIQIVEAMLRDGNTPGTSVPNLSAADAQVLNTIHNDLMIETGKTINF